jgi:hypothetical protein
MTRARPASISAATSTAAVATLLFEGRGALVDTGRQPEPLTDDLTELLQVAGEFRLVLLCS